MWSTATTTTTKQLWGEGEACACLWAAIIMQLPTLQRCVCVMWELRMRRIRRHSPPLDAARTTSLMRHDRPQKYNLIISRTNANANWQSSNRPIELPNWNRNWKRENGKRYSETRWKWHSAVNGQLIIFEKGKWTANCRNYCTPAEHTYSYIISPVFLGDSRIYLELIKLNSLIARKCLRKLSFNPLYSFHMPIYVTSYGFLSITAIILYCFVSKSFH